MNSFALPPEAVDIFEKGTRRRLMPTEAMPLTDCWGIYSNHFASMKRWRVSRLTLDQSNYLARELGRALEHFEIAADALKEMPDSLFLAWALIEDLNVWVAAHQRRQKSGRPANPVSSVAARMAWFLHEEGEGKHLLVKSLPLLTSCRLAALCASTSVGEAITHEQVRQAMDGVARAPSQK